MDAFGEEHLYGNVGIDVGALSVLGQSKEGVGVQIERPKKMASAENVRFRPVSRHNQGDIVGLGIAVKVGEV